MSTEEEILYADRLGGDEYAGEAEAVSDIERLERASLMPVGALADTVGGAARAHLNNLGFISQAVNGSPIYLESGMSLTNICFVKGNSDASAITLCRFGLYDAARNKVAQTANAGAANWLQDTVRSLAIESGPYLVPASGLYYLAILGVGGTLGALAGWQATGFAAAPHMGAYRSGQADLPATLLALTAGQNLPYGYVT